MRKFLNGEREFTCGEVVIFHSSYLFHSSHSLYNAKTHKYPVPVRYNNSLITNTYFGIVSEYRGSGYFGIKPFLVNIAKNLTGVKCPSSTSETPKLLDEQFILISTDSTVKIQKNEIFKEAKDAKRYIDKINQEKESEAALSYEEWDEKENEKDRLRKERINQYNSMPKISHPEKYLLAVCDVQDYDNIPFIKEYTDESPQILFEVYGKSLENVFTLTNKKHDDLENEYSEPQWYKNNMISPQGELQMAEVYYGSHGSFTVVNGELVLADISVSPIMGFNCPTSGGEYCYNLSRGNMSQETINQRVMNKLKKILPKTQYNMFIRAMETLHGEWQGD